MNDKIAKILNGKSGEFTVKEILIEHIRTSQEFRKDVRERLTSGGNNITRNWAFIKSLCTGMGIIFTVLLYIIWR